MDKAINEKKNVERKYYAKQKKNYGNVRKTQPMLKSYVNTEWRQNKKKKQNRRVNKSFLHSIFLFNCKRIQLEATINRSVRTLTHSIFFLQKQFNQQYIDLNSVKFQKQNQRKKLQKKNMFFKNIYSHRICTPLPIIPANLHSNQNVFYNLLTIN